MLVRFNCYSFFMQSGNFFESPFRGIPLNQQVEHPNIVVGRYSYYSGYYHGHSFEKCAWYLSRDRDDVDQLIIGSFCSIGTGAVFVMAGNQGHRLDWVSTFPFYYAQEKGMEEAVDGYKKAGNTVVEHDVWIGAEAMVLPGITIGTGAVVGARALVTKDVLPYTIVAGNPAKTIRMRFSPEEIEKCLEMRW